MSEQEKNLYEFGPFRLDTSERLLLRDGQPVLLTPKAYETLLLLVRRSGHVIEKDDLMRGVWPDTFVEEANLANNISLLRKALGDGADAQQYIQTIPRRGYRFVAEVRQPEENTGGVELQVEPLAAGEGTERHALKEGPRAFITLGRRRFLPSLLIACIALIAVVAGAAYWQAWRRERTPHPRTLAVLPFKPLGAGERDESLELGMADTLIAKLSNVREIVVRPTSAVRRYMDLQQDAVAAGRELQVESVLEGSLQRVGERIRVRVRLVSVSEGKQLWAGQFDEQFTDIFALQDQVSERVAGALAFELSGDARERIAEHSTENIEAYQFYLKGQYFWNKFTPEGDKTAIKHFNQAIALDPTYALAYVGLADSYGVMGTNGWMPPLEAFPKAREAAMKALEMNDQLAGAHCALGANHLFYDWDWSAAERELKRCIDLSPNSPHPLYSYLLTATGRFDEAIAQVERNQQLDPLSPLSYADVTRAYYFARRYDEAIEANRKALEMESTFAISHLIAGAAYEQKGMYEEAIAELRRANSFPGGFSDALGALGHAYAATGQRGEALKILEELKEMSKQKHVSPLGLAILYAGLGDKNQALTELEKAAEDRQGWLINLKVEPRFDSLHSDPRFLNLLRRIGLTS